LAVVHRYYYLLNNVVTMFVVETILRMYVQDNTYCTYVCKWKATYDRVDLHTTQKWHKSKCVIIIIYN